jgi:class 3 adenylate cyclase
VTGVAELPSGTVTFLFADLEGSTTLWEQHPDAMPEALARHDELMTGAIEGRDGYVVKDTGDGFLAAFGARPMLLPPRSMGSSRWRPSRGATQGLRARMGVHTGAAEVRRRLSRSTLNRASRLMSVGHGGQILVSLVTSELVRGAGVELRGPRLARAAKPGRARARLSRVVHPELGSEFAALKSIAPARRNLPSNLPAPVDRFVGHPRAARG